MFVLVRFWTEWGSAEQRLIFLVLMAAGVVLCFLRMCFVRVIF